MVEVAIALEPSGDLFANRAAVGLLDPSLKEADAFADFSQAIILFRQQREWHQYFAALQAIQHFFPGRFQSSL